MKLTRKQVLGAIRVHAYHGRTDEALRLYVSHRVSYTAYQEALRFGMQAKGAGVGCSCAECKGAKP